MFPRLPSIAASYVGVRVNQPLSTPTLGASPSTKNKPSAEQNLGAIANVFLDPRLVVVLLGSAWLVTGPLVRKLA